MMRTGHGAAGQQPAGAGERGSGARPAPVSMHRARPMPLLPQASTGGWSLRSIVVAAVLLAGALMAVSRWRRQDGTLPLGSLRPAGGSGGSGGGGAISVSSGGSGGGGGGLRPPQPSPSKVPPPVRDPIPVAPEPKLEPEPEPELVPDTPAEVGDAELAFGEVSTRQRGAARSAANGGVGAAGDGTRGDVVQLQTLPNDLMSDAELTGPAFASHDLRVDAVLGGVARIVLLFHGCSHDARVWVSDPPERVVVSELLRARTGAADSLVVALSAAASGGGGSGCWGGNPTPASNADLGAVDRLLTVLTTRWPRLATLPLAAVGVSSGGAFASMVATVHQVAALVVYIAPLHPRFAAALPAPAAAAAMRKSMPRPGRLPFDGTWDVTIPPTLFVHMPADSNLAERVTDTARELRLLGVPVSVAAAPPLVLYPTLLSDHAPSRLTPAASTLVMSALAQCRVTRGVSALPQLPATLAADAGALGVPLRECAVLRVPARAVEVAECISDAVDQLHPVEPTDPPALCTSTAALRALCAPGDVLFDVVAQPPAALTGMTLAAERATLRAVVQALLNQAEGMHEMTAAHASTVAAWVRRPLQL